VLNLYDLLADQWEGTNDDQAAAKLHVVADVIDSAARSVQLTDATTHDQTPWRTIGSWVEDSLLLMDLGYYDFHLFHRIDQQGGYFISRVKSNANPTIVRSNQTLRGRSIDLKGHKLQDVLGRLQRETIDVTVALEVELRKYRGSCSTITRHVRMVGGRNEETGEYHLYFTNVSGQQLTPRQVADTYRLRWQIELLFSALKSQMRLHQLPSSKDHVVRALIWASVLACLISNCLLQVMRRMRPDRVFPPQRMHAVFRDFAETILLKLARARRDRPIGLFELMLYEAADPNRSRERSHDVLEDIPLAERPSPPPYREAKR
jgi:IS4 transposase